MHKSGVHHSELFSQESAYNLSLREEENRCLLKCASDQINSYSDSWINHLILKTVNRAP